MILKWAAFITLLCPPQYGFDLTSVLVPETQLSRPEMIYVETANVTF